jgi:hypothetical protein
MKTKHYLSFFYSFFVFFVVHTEKYTYTVLVHVQYVYTKKDIANSNFLFFRALASGNLLSCFFSK